MLHKFQKRSPSYVGRFRGRVRVELFFYLHHGPVTAGGGGVFKTGLFIFSTHVHFLHD